MNGWMDRSPARCLTHGLAECRIILARLLCDTQGGLGMELEHYIGPLQSTGTMAFVVARNGITMRYHLDAVITS